MTAAEVPDEVEDEGGWGNDVDILIDEDGQLYMWVGGWVDGIS